MNAENVAFLGTAYAVPIPSNELGLRLVLRRGDLTSAGTSKAVVDRIDKVLLQISQGIHLSLDLLWAAELVWQGGSADDLEVVKTCIRIIFPVQLQNICSQIDRQFRAGAIDYGNEVAEVRLMLPWFEKELAECEKLIFVAETYEKVKIIAVYLEQVFSVSPKIIDREKVKAAAAGLRFSIRVLETP